MSDADGTLHGPGICQQCGNLALARMTVAPTMLKICGVCLAAHSKALRRVAALLRGAVREAQDP